MEPTILQSEFVTDLVLPFLLVFTLVFAILEKTRILGDEKKQINAIIAFVIGLIFISFSTYVGITTNIMGVVAVVAVVLLVFMMLFAFASGEKELKIPNGVKYTLWILISIVLLISILVFTGYWEKIANQLMTGNTVTANIIFIVIIVVAVIVVLWGGKKSSS